MGMDKESMMNGLEAGVSEGKPSHNMGRGPFWIELAQCIEEGVLTTHV